MIRAGYLSAEDRADLIGLARDGSAAHRLARRANALVLRDDGFSCDRVAAALFVYDETVRRWHWLFMEDGLEGLTRFESGGSCPRLAEDQEAKLKAWIAATLPRSTRQVGAYIEKEFGAVDESRSGLIAMLHRLGLESVKPETIGRKLEPERQKDFIEGYEKLLISLGADEAVRFVDAVHPTHAARPVGCWAPAKENLAIEPTSGAPASQHSRRRRSRNRQDGDDRRRNRRRRLNDPAVGSHRGHVSAAGADPCVSRQCALSSCRSCAGVAGAARQEDQA